MNKFFFVIAWWLCTLSAAYAVDYENALIYYGTGTFVSKTGLTTTGIQINIGSGVRDKSITGLSTTGAKINNIISNTGTKSGSGFGVIATKSGSILSGSIVKSGSKNTESFAQVEFLSALSWMRLHNLTKFGTVEAFKPYQTITREQVAKFVTEYIREYDPKRVKKPCMFLDIGGSEFSGNIISACERGILRGSNGEFKPRSTLTKAQALAIVMRLKGYSSPETGAVRYSDYVRWGINDGIVTATGGYTNPISRYEMGLMLYRLAVSKRFFNATKYDQGSVLQTFGESKQYPDGTIIGNASANILPFLDDNQSILVFKIFDKIYYIKKQKVQSFDNSSSVKLYGTRSQGDTQGTLSIDIVNGKLEEALFNLYSGKIYIHITSQDDQLQVVQTG